MDQSICHPVIFWCVLSCLLYTTFSLLDYWIQLPLLICCCCITLIRITPNELVSELHYFWLVGISMDIKRENFKYDIEKLMVIIALSYSK